MPDCIKPTPRQMAYQDWELGLFTHFGLMTFCDGPFYYQKPEALSPEQFNPTQLDCNQWAELM